MRPAVDLQNVVVEILDAQAEARDSQIPDRLKFAFREGSRFALEGDFFGLVPGQQALHALDQARKLPRGNVRWCAPSKVNESRLASADEGSLGVEGQFSDGGIQIAFHLGSVLIGIDFEVTKVTS